MMNKTISDELLVILERAVYTYPIMSNEDWHKYTSSKEKGIHVAIAAIEQLIERDYIKKDALFKHIVWEKHDAKLIEALKDKILASKDMASIEACREIDSAYRRIREDK